MVCGRRFHLPRQIESRTHELYLLQNDISADTRFVFFAVLFFPMIFCFSVVHMQRIQQAYLFRYHFWHIAANIAKTTRVSIHTLDSEHTNQHVLLRFFIV